MMSGLLQSYSGLFVLGQANVTNIIQTSAFSVSDITVGIVGQPNYHVMFMVRSDKTSIPLDRLFGHELSNPIHVTITCEGDSEFVASAPELNMAMAGESAGDAHLALKEHLEMAVQSFSQNRNNLGPGPERQLKMLEAYIGERGSKY
jgi:hypothetical protein